MWVLGPLARALGSWLCSGCSVQLRGSFPSLMEVLMQSEVQSSVELWTRSDLGP